MRKIYIFKKQTILLNSQPINTQMDEMWQKKNLEKIALINLSWYDIPVILIIRSSQPDKSNQTHNLNHETIKLDRKKIMSYKAYFF